MDILGFDPSLISSGYAIQCGGEYRTGRILTKKLRGAERLDYIARCFDDLFARSSIGLVVLEGYAMGGKVNKGRLFDIGELGGVLKVIAWRKGVRLLLVPPSNLKKFATGKGRAEKQDVVKAIAEEWGYNIPQNDEADAFVLCRIGEAFLRSRKPRQSFRAEALKGCQLAF